MTAISNPTDALELAQIETAIRSVVMWPYPTKDINRLYNVCAKDTSFFIFMPNSTDIIDGFEPFHQLAEQVYLNPKFQAKGTEIKDLKIWYSGNVAWYACILDDRGEWDGHPTDWVHARWTGVLEKREGKWINVMMHYSLPADEIAKAVRESIPPRQ